MTKLEPHLTVLSLGLTFSLALYVVACLPRTAPPPPHPATHPTPMHAAGICSQLMDGAMSDFQLWKLKRLVGEPRSDSDKAAFHYSIYHHVLHA